MYVWVMEKGKMGYPFKNFDIEREEAEKVGERER